MNTTELRWGGKRRPRITIPRAITGHAVKTLYKVTYKDREGKQWYANIAASGLLEIEKWAKRQYLSPERLVSIQRTNEPVHFLYETYDVRYRGEHQDLLDQK